MRGNGISLYYLTAKCGDCVSEQNSVRFVCCGKLKTDEFRQGDKRWGNNILGSHPPHYHISQTGCALTSVANLINFYANISTSIVRTDPGILNQEMIESGIGYNDNDDILWEEVPFLANDTIIPLESPDVMWGDSIEEVFYLLNNDIERGLPVVIRSERPPIGNRRRDHFMLVIGKCDNKYIVVDPAIGGVIRYDPYNPNLLLQGVRRYEQR